MELEQHISKSPCSFVDALNRHVDTSDIFWDRDFLDIVVDHFPFQHLAIVIYDDDFHFVDSLNCGRARPFGDYYKKVSFQDQDLLAHFISNNFDELARRNEIIKSSDVLPKGYKDYANILKRGSLQYAAVLPIDHTYRLAAYKGPDTGDFSDDDISKLHDLMSLVKFGYQNFKKQKRTSTLSRVKTTLLDNIGVGCILMDKDFHILDCNDLATYATSIVLDSDSGESVSDQIMRLFPDVRQPARLQRSGYTLTINPYREIGYYGKVEQYYSLMFTKDSSRGKMRLEESSQFPFSSLSPRELEVLEAFAQGMEYKDISQQLFISEGTLRTHLKNIYRKLNITNQRKLIYEYMKYRQNNL